MPDNLHPTNDLHRGDDDLPPRDDFRKRNEVKIRFEENWVEVKCDQEVERLEVAAWRITNSSTTEKMTTPGFNRVKVMLKSGESRNYFLRADGIREDRFKLYQLYTFQGPKQSGALNVTDPEGIIVAQFSQ